MLQVPEGIVRNFFFELIGIQTRTLAFHFDPFQILIFKISKVNKQKQLKSYQGVEDTPKVDDEILSSKGKGSRINCNFRVVIGIEGVGKGIRDET